MTGNSSPEGMIYKIRRFSTFDGPGIRTTVFLKGCPLRCPWCSEPDGQNPERELIYYEDLCAGCESCLSICSGLRVAEENRSARGLHADADRVDIRPGGHLLRGSVADNLIMRGGVRKHQRGTTGLRAATS